ncbi:MAG: sigma-70 family RNA polymerase sigma factor [Actinomycetota bacterium]|nr:sigma-70 family RNA polymerase sigma factor [Actinomycetota bacterium]
MPDLALGSSAEPDAVLVARMAGGEDNAVAALYDRWAGVLLTVATRITRERADAEEVLAEVFAQAWRDSPRFDPARGSVAAWLTMITRSRALDLLRTRGRRARLEEAAATEPALPLSVGQGPTAPDLPIEDQERRDAVRGAMADLPEPQRVAVELAYFEGLSQSEIAERLGQPLGTVKTRIRLAMDKLRDSLRPYYDAEPAA